MRLRGKVAIITGAAAGLAGQVQGIGGATARLFAERGLSPVTFSQWQKIDQAQIAAANPGAPRRKFVSVADMLAVL